MTKLRIGKCLECVDFPCEDVNHNCYNLPQIALDPLAVKAILISEAVPPDPEDDYYAGDNAAYARSTVQAFTQAGVSVSSFQDLLDMGFYFTSAVKCGKTGYGIKAATIKTCSFILEQELNLFPSVQAYLLMGDVAIKAVNYIAKRETNERAIPAGSTYKIRGGSFTFRSKPAFPSYLQVGPSFGIEKSKQRMIAEDIARVMALLR
jgi:uracil-DNA glycosylase